MPQSQNLMERYCYITILYVKMKLNFSTMFHPKYWTLGEKMLFKKGVRRKKAKGKYEVKHCQHTIAYELQKYAVFAISIFTALCGDDSTTRRLDDLTTRRLDDSTTRRLDDSTTRRIDDSTTRRLNDSTTRRLNDSTTRQLDDSTTRRVDLDVQQLFYSLYILYSFLCKILSPRTISFL